MVLVLVVVVLTVIAGHAVVEVPSQFLGFVGRFLRLVGGLFGLVGLLLGAFSAVASLLGGGASFVGTQDGPGNRLVVAPFVGELGRFLGQVGGFLRLICGLRRAFGPLPGLLGQVARVLGDLPGLVGLLLGLGLGAVRFLGLGVFRGGAVSALGVFHGRGRAFRDRGCAFRGEGRAFIPVVGGGVTLVLHRAPGHAVGLTGLCHALAGGGLAGLVLSHDRFSLARRPASARHGERARPQPAHRNRHGCNRAMTRRAPES